MDKDDHSVAEITSSPEQEETEEEVKDLLGETEEIEEIVAEVEGLTKKIMA